MKLQTLVLAIACTMICFGGSMAQTKPATSGKSSFNEPEPNPNGPGEYHPNERHEGKAPFDAHRSRSQRSGTR